MQRKYLLNAFVLYYNGRLFCVLHSVLPAEHAKVILYSLETAYMNTYVVLSLAIILNALANILMKVAMLKQEKTTDIMTMVTQSLTNPVLFLGLVSFGLALVAYCFVLAKINLSIAYPLMTSLGFLIVILASWLFLGENISKIQIVGFTCIIAGVWMVAR